MVQSALDSCSCITPLLWQQRADLRLLGFVSSGSVKTSLDQLQPYTSQLRHSWNHSSFTEWPGNPFRGTGVDWSHLHHIQWGISAWITDRWCPAHLLYLYFPHCSLCAPSVIFIEGTTHTAGVQLLPTKDPYLSINKALKKWLSFTKWQHKKQILFSCTFIPEWLLIFGNIYGVENNFNCSTASASFNKK